MVLPTLLLTLMSADAGVPASPSEVEVLLLAAKGPSASLEPLALKALRARRATFSHDWFDPAFRLTPIRLKGRVGLQQVVLKVTRVEGFTFEGTLEWEFEHCTALALGVWEGNQALFLDPKIIVGECPGYTLNEVKVGFFSRTETDGLRFDGWDGPSKHRMVVIERFEQTAPSAPPRPPPTGSR